MLEGLRSSLRENKVIIGSKQTVKNLKLKNVKSVIMANNCPENIKRDINYYAKVSGVKIENFDGTAKQLGIFCGKPFPIASLAIRVK